MYRLGVGIVHLCRYVERDEARCGFGACWADFTSGFCGGGIVFIRSHSERFGRYSYWKFLIRKKLVGIEQVGTCVVFGYHGVFL